MLITIIAIVVLATGQPQADSTLTELCEARNVNCDTVYAAFEALDSCYSAEVRYKRAHGSFLTFNVLDSFGVLPDTFAVRTSCTFPESQLLNGSFRMAVAHKLVGEAPDACTVLIISFFNVSADNHLPIVQLTCCLATGERKYEYTHNRANILWHAP
ncbi:MAG: hypothetical protein WC505_05555 [Patescibacteria group bacterium]